MEKLLIYIKHHFGFIWKIIDRGNELFFTAVYLQKLKRVLFSTFNDFNTLPYSFRRLVLTDMESLHDLIVSQEDSDLKYFSPHGFDIISLERQFRNHSFLMMGVFDDKRLVGYFFLRFFLNRKCFVGRLIDKEYRGKGIGQIMNKVMYETAWRLDFRCLSTISKDNVAILKAHSKNKAMVVLKELQNNYILVEFVKSELSVADNPG